VRIFDEEWGCEEELCECDDEFLKFDKLGIGGSTEPLEKHAHARLKVKK
jgi:hypothetical protein